MSWREYSCLTTLNTIPVGVCPLLASVCGTPLPCADRLKRGAGGVGFSQDWHLGQLFFDIGMGNSVDPPPPMHYWVESVGWGLLRPMAIVEGGGGKPQTEKEDVMDHEQKSEWCQPFWSLVPRRGSPASPFLVVEQYDGRGDGV